MSFIHHLFSSPSHNYVGHHGQPSGDEATIDHHSLELVAGKGIIGDRFFDWKDNFKGQITFIDLAVIEDVREFVGDSNLLSSVFRRNVVISGVDLNRLINRTFFLNEIEMSGSEECSPCYWMDEACSCKGVESLMRERGGLRCRILRSGTLTTGPASLTLGPALA